MKIKDKDQRELALKGAVEDVKWYLKHYPELREKFGMNAEAQDEVTHRGSPAGNSLIIRIGMKD